MKKTLFIMIIAMFFLNVALIADVQKVLYDENKQYREVTVPENMNVSGNTTRTNYNPATPAWEFTHAPETFGPINYYDYMPGSYCSHPIMKQKEGLQSVTGQSYGPGVYMLYHGRAGTAAEINRRIYFGYVNPDQSISSATVTAADNWQGYPGMSIHPASGSCLASWHVELPGVGHYQTSITYDDIQLLGIPGFWKSPLYFTQPADSLLYIWPYVFVGPSPTYATDGKVRIYQISNADNDNRVEDALIRYTDIPDVNFAYGELEQILTEANWSTPQRIFSDWHVGTPIWPSNASSRPYPSFAVDWNNPGHVSFMGFAGFHAVTELTGVPTYVEPGPYVWESFDGGETWDTSNFHNCPFMVNESTTERKNRYALYKVENTAGFTFTDSLNNQYTPDSLRAYPGWPGNEITGHRSAMYDKDGNIHLPIQLQYVAFEYEDGMPTSSYSTTYFKWAFQAELVYNADGTWELNHVPEMEGTASGWSVPWTVEGSDTTWYPTLSMPYSDISELGFHENLQNVAVSKDHNWIAQIWADGTKLLKAENPGIDYPGGVDENYLNHPIISISCKGGTIGDGNEWSDPIELSDIYSNPFGDQITVYPYIAPYIADLGDGWGEIYILYYDDNDYGSSIQGIGATTGGYMYYTAVKIYFGPDTSIDPGQTEENVVSLSNYPNPFVTSTRISFSMSKPIVEASVNIYNLKGQLVKTMSLETSDDPFTGHADWDGKDISGRNVANGIYFYKINADNNEYIQKMVLTR